MFWYNDNEIPLRVMVVTNQSINQSRKHIYIVPCIAGKSEVHLMGDDNQLNRLFVFVCK